MAARLGHVEAFNLQTDDWSLYTERLSQYFVANDITDDKKKVAVLLTVMGSKAYELLHSLLSPVVPSTKKYDELIAKLEAHLKPKPLVIAERFRFHHRNQRDGETVAQYMAELRRLSEHCEFKDYLDEVLRDRLVCGLRSEAIQRRLLSEKDLTLAKAYDIAHSEETASRQASQLQASAKPETSTEGDVQRVAPRKTSDNGTVMSCYRCGKTGHPPDKCYFKHQKCRVCHRKGHIAKVCRNQGLSHGNPSSSSSHLPTRKNPQMQKWKRSSGSRAGYVEAEEEGQAPTLQHDGTLFALTHSQDTPITLTPLVNGVQFPMELDTGATVSLASEEVWKEHFNACPLEPCMTLLRTYTGERLQVLGQLTVDVKYEDQEAKLPLLIVPGNGPALWGRSWLSTIRLNWATIKFVTQGIRPLLALYPELFKEELGTLRDVEIELTLVEGAVPRFKKPRPVPYALRGTVERELERLENLGVIEKTKFSHWAAPIVTVPKPDGGVRICGDYKVTINPVLEVDQYPVPKAEDLFATLAGGEKFTKLDLSHAYQQVLLSEESRQYVTVNTHKGLYRYNRLPFGIASAPAIFQQTMEKLLHGISGVTVYIDDILVTGQTDEEHLHNLNQVLERLQHYGLRLKRGKCSFMQSSVRYLGYLIDKEGLHKTPEKVQALLQKPAPKNVKKLRSFLGLVNYYGKFIKNLSTIIQPLNHLLQHRTRWFWSKECQCAFETLKEKMASSEVLVHYDPSLPLKLDCDASAYGVGAVLSHTFPNGDERPVAYASRTLTQTERGYAQIEKEALSLIFGVKKFHQYLYGRKFLLVTDHKPLLTILGPKKELPTLAAARLQRWAVLLSAYQYDIEFRSTDRHSNADGFSRLPVPPSQTKQDVAPSSVFNLTQIACLPIDADGLQKATREDTLLSRVVNYVQRGWPSSVDSELKPFWNKRMELSIEAGCLLWGMRVVVPRVCQQAVLEELHAGHPGIVKMKSLARIHVWWCGIDKDIEQLV